MAEGKAELEEKLEELTNGTKADLEKRDQELAAAQVADERAQIGGRLLSLPMCLCLDADFLHVPW